MGKGQHVSTGQARRGLSVPKNWNPYVCPWFVLERSAYGKGRVLGVSHVPNH